MLGGKISHHVIIIIRYVPLTSTPKPLELMALKATFEITLLNISPPSGKNCTSTGIEAVFRGEYIGNGFFVVNLQAGDEIGRTEYRRLVARKINVNYPLIIGLRLSLWLSFHHHSALSSLLFYWRRLYRPGP